VKNSPRYAQEAFGQRLLAPETGTLRIVGWGELKAATHTTGAFGVQSRPGKSRSLSGFAFPPPFVGPKDQPTIGAGSGSLY